MSRILKKIKSFFKSESNFTREDLKLLQDLVEETTRLCKEMQSNAYLIEVTKAQQKTLIGLNEQVNVYERILSGRSFVHPNESEELN